MWFRRILLVVAMLVSSCSALSPATPQPTATATLPPSPTLTPSATSTFTPIPPTETATLTPSATFTLSPTETATAVPTAIHTPQASVLFTYDNWEFLELPSNIIARLDTPLIAFLNTNNRTGSAATPLPGNNIQTLYYVSPTNSAARITIKQFDSSTGDEIYIAPSGDAFAYMRYDGGSIANGLYIADFNVGITGRVLPLASLTQRGIFNTPAWKSDGSMLALAVATGYDIDIFTIERDGAWANLINSGAYDFWPVWSPDGNYLAFVSDRVTCPSWRPGEVGTCDGSSIEAPTGGHVFVLNIATGQITQISDVVVHEPPKWATPRQITFASGDPLFGDPERVLYSADIFSNEVRRIRLNTSDIPLKLSEVWSPSGQQVLFQAAETSSSIVLAQISGAEIARITDRTFARYGLRADWSPDGTRIAIGGVAGQCPYGIIVTDNQFTSIASGNPPPTMCEPQFSPDGRWVAFTGVVPNRDGRVDVYVANQNGFGAVNLTGSLTGNVKMIGWAGG